MSANLKQLDALLELIEQHIDIGHIKGIDERYRRSLAYEEVDCPPLVCQPAFGKCWQLPEPWDKFEHYSYKQSFDDPVAMMQNMLLDRVVPGLILKDDSALAIRNDHGTIQIASLLSGSWQLHEDNYPWVKSLGSTEAIRALVENNNEIDVQGGVLPQSIRTLGFYQEKLSRYPRCKQGIQISLPDLQGPMDTADILWGTEIFLMILQEPELVIALLEKVVRTMLAATEHYRRYTYDRLDPAGNSQHGYNIPGRLMIRNDSSIMISPDTYREIVLPSDATLLQKVGKGSIHFCGNGQHLVEPMLEIPDLCGFDFGQAKMMDVKKIYEIASQRKVALTCLKPSRNEFISGQAATDFPTGVVMAYNTESIDDAYEVITAYRARQDSSRNKTASYP